LFILNWFSYSGGEQKKKKEKEKKKKKYHVKIGGKEGSLSNTPHCFHKQITICRVSSEIYSVLD